MVLKHVVSVWVLVMVIQLPWGSASGAADGGEDSNTVLPVATNYSSVELDITDTCPTEYQRNVALDHISSGIRSKLVGIPEKIIKCDAHHLGKFPHCPVDNCSVLFDRAEEGFIRFSGVYWLQPPNEDATKVFCNQETGYPEVSSCSLLFRYHSTAKSGHYTILLRDGIRSVVYCNRETGQPEPESCAHAHQLELPTGDYTLRPPPDNFPLNHAVHCDMDREECGSGTWWLKLASLDFSNTSTPCPENWQLMTSPIRACVRTTDDGCDSYFFSSHGHSYSRVCGRVAAYQRGPAFGFWLSGHSNGLDDPYLNGVSVTHGDIPRQHIWSYAASLGNSFCPCSHTEAILPSFVGNHYFCETDDESGPSPGILNLDNLLWDGSATCSNENPCCQFNNPPWFSRELPNATADAVEVRLCGISGVSNYSTPITMLDLYVQ